METSQAKFLHLLLLMILLPTLLLAAILSPRDSHFLYMLFEKSGLNAWMGHYMCGSL